MNKVLQVAWREFLVTVRTKAFLLTVVLMPGLIMMGTFGGQWVQKASRQTHIPTRTLAVLDKTEVLLPALEQGIARHNEERRGH